MTTSDDSRTIRVLRALDAADPAFEESVRQRAAATLERILATDPEAPAPTAAPRRKPSPRVRRVLLAGGAVAAAAVVVAVPMLTGRDEAFASWSPTPVELTGADRTAAARACLALQGTDESELAFDPDSRASVLVAEARGGWQYVVFTVAGLSGTELQGSCLVPDDLVADPRPGEGGFFGSLGPADEEAGSPPPRDLAREDSHAIGSVDGQAFVHVEGRAGADVVGIEVTTPSGMSVEASIDNGRWAAWWPAGDDSMDNPELAEAPAYEVTLRDGTVTDEVRGLG